MKCKHDSGRSLRRGPDVPKGQLGIATCTVEGCDRRRVGWGLCGLHYARWKRSGSVKQSHRSQARAETIAEDGTRRCWNCGERKPFDADHFPKDGRRPGDLKGTCIACRRKASRRSTIRLLYGLSEEDYADLVSRQGNRCAVCQLPFDGYIKSMTPHVDHCHETGKVRGILCHNCNLLLGHAKDSRETLLQAISYLEAFDAAR